MKVDDSDIKTPVDYGSYTMQSKNLVWYIHHQKVLLHFIVDLRKLHLEILSSAKKL